VWWLLARIACLTRAAAHSRERAWGSPPEASQSSFALAVISATPVEERSVLSPPKETPPEEF
jgi:hypothetical protein